jgi:cytochrome d ubiquinol oxidase subunit II
MQEAFRTRALGAGVVAGAIALAGLPVVHGDAHSLFTELLSGGALAAMIVSMLAGAGTLALVYRRRFEAARYGAAVAVAAVIAGWALARYPTLLPGLSVHTAAASHNTLVCLTVAVLAGGALLFPSLGLLFGLTLRGHFDPQAATGAQNAGRASAVVEVPLGPRLAVALLVIGVGMLNAATAPWAHAVGVVSLFGFMIVAFAVIVPRALTEPE